MRNIAPIKWERSPGEGREACPAVPEGSRCSVEPGDQRPIAVLRAADQISNESSSESFLAFVQPSDQ